MSTELSHDHKLGYVSPDEAVLFARFTAWKKPSEGVSISKN
jgi:hypothetical protein